MNKYFLPVILLMAAAMICLDAKPSWIIHNGTNPAELGARVTDIENNFKTHDTITADALTITTETITTANITTGNITTLRAGTTDITAGDSILTTYLRAGTASDIIGADSITATRVNSTYGDIDTLGTTNKFTVAVIRGKPDMDTVLGRPYIDSIDTRCLTSTGNVNLSDTTKAIFIGGQTTERSYRISVVGDSLCIYKYISSSWARCGCWSN